MPLDLELLKKALGDGEDAEKVVEHVLSAIAEEKAIGISAKKKVDKEAAGLRIFKKALESAGFKADEHDVDDFLADLKSAKEKIASGDVTEKSELVKLQKAMATLQKQFEQSESEKAQLRDKSRRSTIRSKLQAALGDRVYSSRYVIDGLINDGRVAVNESDEVVWTDGDDEVEFDAGVKSFLESNTDIVKNIQKGGSGSGGGDNNTKAKYTEADIENMSAEELRKNLPDVLAAVNK